MFVSKYFLTQNVFGPKYFWDQISFIPKMIHIAFRFKTHSWQIQNILENFCWIKIFFGPKKFLIPNIFGTKFLLYLSYDSHSIHVQNTFLTDSKQIQKFLENMFGSKYFLTQNAFGPKYFWGQIAFIPKLWFTYHSCSKHIPDRFKTDSKSFWKICWDQNIFWPKMFWSQIFLEPNFLYT